MDGRMGLEDRGRMLEHQKIHVYGYGRDAQGILMSGMD